MEANDVKPDWGFGKRLLFRYLFSYLFLFIFPFPLYYIPYVGQALGPFFDLWEKGTLWMGRLVFGREIVVHPSGSGDTAHDWADFFFRLLLAVAVTLVWSLLGLLLRKRKRLDYDRLHGWLRIYVRFSLASAMISYGAYKLIPSQMPAPTLDRLLQPLGDASPMGLLWTFMGASAAYSIFTGAAEMLGGLLLTTRRTTLLGALVSIGVMSNVVMLNFSYDVPVKLYSSHLLFEAFFLAAPDLRRLLDVLVLNRPSEPAPLRPLFRRRGLEWGTLALRTAFVGFLAWQSLNLSYKTWSTYTPESRAKTPLHGIWNVDELAIDGQVRPPLLTDEQRWQRVVFDVPGQMAVFRMSDTRDRYNVEVDEKKKTLAMTDRFNPERKITVAYRQPAPDRLALEGTFDGRKIRALLHRARTPEFLLLTRGFHWINETPYNR
ncbi:MAG: hypothetical protein ABUT39_12390 [Acidobacteriota bacterium]